MNHKLEDYSKDELISLIKSLRARKKFGLVWEQKSETIVNMCAENFPVLKEVQSKEIQIDACLPVNLIIEGDNYHSLSVLNYTHANKIDVIYIDPPYNTGSKDFIYNDTFIDREDTFRHSKWLSFMSRRLVLAKELLTDQGIIFISIGEDEYAQLKILCDEIFGEDNYITNFIWEKTQHFGRQKVNSYNNSDYILTYAKKLKGSKLKELLVEKVKTEFEDAPLYNAGNPMNTLTFPKGSVKFNIADGEYSSTTDDKYELQNKVKIANGRNLTEFSLKFRSRWSQATVEAKITQGTTFWVKSEKFAVRAIYPSDKTSNESPKQILFSNRNNEFQAVSRFGQKIGVNEEASAELKDIIGEQDTFSYPKPKSLITYLLSLIFDPEKDTHLNNFTVLDFFAGSGTTGHAVMELNSLDGGTRKFILCTNNENGIAENVTYRRIKSAIEGYGTTKGIPANIRYFQTDFVSKEATDDQTRVKLVERSQQIISVREETFEILHTGEHITVMQNPHKLSAIVYDQDAIPDLISYLSHIETSKEVSIYVFSLSNDNYQNDFTQLNLKYFLKPIPEGLLSVYRRIFYDHNKKLGE